MRFSSPFLAITTAFLLPGGVAAGSSDRLSVIEHGLPANLETASEYSVSIVLANDGLLPWSPEEGYAVSYHWLSPGGETVLWDGRRTPLPRAVPPGASIELAAFIETPRRPGDYLLLWDVVQEGVRWLSETDTTPSEPVPVSVSVGHAFAVVEGTEPRLMTTGSESVVKLVLQNDGGRAWLADGRFAASYHWLGGGGVGVRPNGRRVHWEGRRTPIPAFVPSAGTVELEVVVVAPDRAGLWRLQWDLVEEGVCWFSDRAPEPPPIHRVLVVPGFFDSGFWWSGLVLFAAAAAVTTWRSGGPRALITFFGVADIAWCVGTLSVKQGIVLAQIGARLTTTGWVLAVVGATALAFVTVLFPERARGWACWGLAACGTLLLWGDSIYVRFFGDLPAATAIAGADQLGRVEASIRELLAPADMWLWLDLLPALVVVMVANRLRRGSKLRTRVLAIILGAAVAAGGLTAVRLAVTQPDLFAQVFRRVRLAEEVGVLNLHAIDATDAVADRVFGRELEPARFDEVVRWFSERAPTRAGTGPSFGAAEGANLVMVQVESLQNFVIGLEIGGREVTPFLNRWVEEALWFSNVTDQTGHGRSSDSELATQVSLLPMSGAAAAFRHAANDFTGLAEALTERGYHTLSAVPYEGAFWNRYLTHPAFGYRRSLFVEDFEAGQNIGWGLSDRDFLGQAAALLAETERPFAAYLLTLSLHHPFSGFPSNLQELDVGTWDGTAFGNFLHTMHFFDSSLTGFVTALEETGLGDNTVIAIWGDHDAGFPWRTEIASAMGATHDAAGWYLSQEVPLFIRVPGADAVRGERVVAAGHADVAPTLLAVLGVDPSTYAFVGRNLLGGHGNEPVVGEYGCWRDATHLFLQGDGSLDDGTCIELGTMSTVSSAECRRGYEEARRMEEISALVLDYDLQHAVHHELLDEQGPQR